MQTSIFATIATLAGLATVSQVSAPIDAAYFDGSSDLCAIYLDQSADGTYLAALAAEGTEGEYVFSLRQGGSGGSSQIVQSGEFFADAEGPILLSEMTLDLSGTYEASLQTYSWNGEFMCRAII